MSKTFKALMVEKAGKDRFTRNIKKCLIDNLPDNKVLIEVHYSALNYKDALSATGNKGVTQHFPHIPGVDAAGIVVESDDKRFSSGDEVIVTSFDLGQNTSGGFGQYIRVPADWIVSLPDNLTLRESMMLGTAGFTAAYGVYKIMQSNTKSNIGQVLVTGATGGVGSLAVALFARNGFEVIAATGKIDQKKYLQQLGATKIVDRDEVYVSTAKPLLSSRWNAVFDTVGGSMLDDALRQTAHNGVVACCGNILGGELNTSIYPFILRGVSLLGIDSGSCLMPMRKKIWNLLSDNWKLSNLETICRECTLEELNREIDKILEGRQVGKVLVGLKK